MQRLCSELIFLVQCENLAGILLQGKPAVFNCSRDTVQQFKSVRAEYPVQRRLRF